MSVINTVDEYAENHEEIAKLRAAQAAQGVDGAAGPYIPPEHDGEVPFLQLEDIYKIYQMGSEEVHANDGISVNIYHGEFVAIVGKSGSGKSTLMNIIGALDVPTKGEYLIQGVDTSHMADDELAAIRNHKIGFIFQQYNLLPKDNLVDNVSLPLLYAGLSKSDQRKRAMKQLERVGLADKWMQHPAQLSGGQQQRVSIARALAGDPELILADEPTGALDTKTSRQVMGFLQDINQDGTTVVMITHDKALALGAKRRTILSQFVIEAAVTSSLGGLIGIAVGFVGTSAAGKIMGIDASPTFLSVLVSFMVSVMIGLIFGYLPARRAAALNPIDALRSD